MRSSMNWLRHGAAALLCALGLGCGANSGDEEAVSGVSSALVTCPTTVVPLRSIEIVHPNIVNDARASNAALGPWSFGALIRNMAPSSATTDVDAFLRGIFESWLTDQVVNGQTLTARPSIDTSVLNFFTIPGSSPRRFDLTKIPFQLIAIANRVDLRSATTGGEGRFVFGLNLPAQGTSKGGFQSFTIIFEYALPLNPPLDAAAKWAAKWHELDALSPDTQAAAFSAKLQEITDAFSARGAFAGRPNGNAIDQVRSNEIFIGDVWQMREFNMSTGGLMLPATTKNSPNHGTLNGSQALLDFVNQTPALAANDLSFLTVNMPTTFESAPFLGGKAEEQPSERWILPNNETQDNSVRADNLGILTCNGCHDENKVAGDIPFYQVSPTAGTFSPTTGLNDGSGRLSRFMLVGDPSKGNRRPAELTRRAADMQALLCPPSGPPDLVVSAVTWTPTSFAAGQRVTFSATVSNQGTGATPAGTIVGVSFNVDGQQVSWSDTHTQSLAPGASVTLTANSGPSGQSGWLSTAGLHTVQAWVDDVNRVAESNESNNKRSVPLSVGIDLSVTSASFSPGAPVNGNAVTFSATVKNVGSVPTPAGVIVGVAFAIDGTLVNWSDTSTASVAPGQSVTLTANGGPAGSSSWPAHSGTHTLQAWVDDVNRFNDVDRSNNKLQAPLAVP
jgi:hypothetical protein